MIKKSRKEMTDIYLKLICEKESKEKRLLKDIKNNKKEVSIGCKN